MADVRHRARRQPRRDRRPRSSARCARSASASVAVYSDADAGAPHVREADVAVRLGPAPAAQSYLDIERDRRAAAAQPARRRCTPATASCPRTPRSPGPAPRPGSCSSARRRTAIEAMGDKIRGQGTRGAPPACRSCPGVDGAGHDRRRAAPRRRTSIGFPLLIKPSAGGGGKGMRARHATASELAEALAAARREARGAFGDDTLLARALHRAPAPHRGAGARRRARQRRAPRRARVQPAAPPPEDHRGGAVAAARRRRRRRRDGRAGASPRPAACGYVGAGTVEFIVLRRPPGRVLLHGDEHPAAGRAPGHRAGDRARPGRAAAARRRRRAAAVRARTTCGSTGHAVEARVYAEDPARGFLPTGGRGAARWPSRTAPTSASTPGCRPAPRSAAATTRCWPR